jgi:hypothetical protein
LLGLAQALPLLHTVRLALSRTTRLPVRCSDTAKGPVHWNAGNAVKSGTWLPALVTASLPWLVSDSE